MTYARKHPSNRRNAGANRRLCMVDLLVLGQLSREHGMDYYNGTQKRKHDFRTVAALIAGGLAKVIIATEPTPGHKPSPLVVEPTKKLINYFEREPE